MTAGQMNCFSQQGVACIAEWSGLRQLSWSEQLRILLQAAMPNCTIRVQLVISPGETITSVFKSIHEIATQSADLVIEDFAVNDNRRAVIVDGRNNDSHKLHSIIGGHEYLAHQLRARQIPLLMTEAFVSLRRPLICSTFNEEVHEAISKGVLFSEVADM